MYDPGLNEWRMQGTMTEPRFSMGIVSHQVKGGTMIHKEVIILFTKSRALSTLWEAARTPGVTCKSW